MNTNFIPPDPKVLEKALELVTIILNPEPAKKYLDGLKVAAQEFKDRTTGFVAKEDELNARQAGVEKREAELSDVAHRNSGITEALTTWNNELVERENRLEDREASVRTNGDYVNAELAKLKTLQTNYEQTSASRTKELDEREAKLTSSHNELNARHAKIKELVGG